jgi:predicted lipoprotein with Yx(FWY)xxD motif
MMRKIVLLLAAPMVLAACGAATAASTGGYHAAAPGAAASATASPSGTPAPIATPTAAPSAAPVATPAPTHAPAPAPPPRPAPVVFVASNMQLGAILVNGAGRTLYYFVPERGGRIVCTGSCTGVWPPLFSGSGAATSSVALPGQLSLIMRVGGAQVTYNHWPLYTFAGDTGPDQINGQGVFGFGGKWFVATPALQP